MPIGSENRRSTSNGVLDTLKSVFRFLNYVPYEVPVEIKKRSAGFTYQEKKYGKEELTRAVILCMNHNMIVIPRYIDVVELSYLARAESLDS